MSYSRANPSPRYLELLSMYRQLHECGETTMGLSPQQTFNGASLIPQLTRIKRLIERFGAVSLLDYGSGKGFQYDPRPIEGPDGVVFEGVIDFWDVASVHCYDPCYAPYSRLPQGRFDGVVSTDVLEHCPEEDVPWILDEIFDYAEDFVYANIASYPARKCLPNGENAHCTIKPRAWWEAIMKQAASKRPVVVWEVWLQSQVETADGVRFLEERMGTS